MNDLLLCLSLPDGLLGWGGLGTEPGLVYRRAVVGGSHIWKPACKLWLPCACSLSVIHHVACVKPEKSQAKKKTACPFLLFLFPAFCLIGGVVGLVSIQCQVRSVPLAVLCWHGWPNAFPFCSDSLPPGHVCPLKFEILAVCVLYLHPFPL